ncbi:hypothetical protein TrST_g6224 [Triparma strigata]|uniref:TIR domain-containing protein n=1 Tax=Triparma strigata TaxID=1606541 RepID=A0A9W7EPW9_9STRA|nr:hypothetical protein TrST_g6224 [Triparma strigata]
MSFPSQHFFVESFPHDVEKGAPPTIPLPATTPFSASQCINLLTSAQTSAHSHRLRVTYLTLSVATLPCFASNVVYYLTEYFFLNASTSLHAGFWGINVCLFGFPMLLSVLPTDNYVIRVINLLAVGSLLGTSTVVFALVGYAWFGEPEVAYVRERYRMCEDKGAECAVFCLKYVALGAVLAGGSLSKTMRKGLMRKGGRRTFDDEDFVVPARKTLDNLWFSTRVTIGAAGVCFLVGAMAAEAVGSNWNTRGRFAWDIAMGLFWCIYPKFWSGHRRRLLHALLGSINTKGETSSAAALAALLCGKSSMEVLEMSVERFVSLDLDKLESNHFLASNKAGEGDEDLFSKAQPSQLGKCDAFVSHSWSDDGEAKFKALKQWARKFKEKNGRSPNVWLDKFCINQTAIDENLQCLPVFLSGSKQLLVLAGKTYCERLWCLMEVFTFLRMGGDLDRIIVVPIGWNDVSAKAAFEEVDITEAKCYLDSDRQRLWAIIEAGFGDFFGFNQIIRHVFLERTLTQQSSRGRRFSFNFTTISARESNKVLHDDKVKN